MAELPFKYFVLKPLGRDNYARASRMALSTYAMHIEKHDGELARAIDHWLAEIHTELIRSSVQSPIQEIIQELPHTPEQVYQLLQKLLQALRQEMKLPLLSNDMEELFIALLHETRLAASGVTYNPDPNQEAG